MQARAPPPPTRPATTTRGPQKGGATSPASGEENVQARLTADLNYFRYLEVLVHVVAQACRSVLVSDVLVVRHATEEVVTLGRDIRCIPFLSLQRHVAFLLLRFEVFKEDRHAVTGGMLQRESDEDKADAKLAEVIPRYRALLVEPFERR